MLRRRITHCTFDNQINLNFFSSQLTHTYKNLKKIVKYLIASHIKHAFIKYGWHSTISRSENLVYILKVDKNGNKTYKFGLNEFPANVVISYSYHVLKNNVISQ